MAFEGQLRFFFGKEHGHTFFSFHTKKITTFLNKKTMTKSDLTIENLTVMNYIP